MREFDYDLDYKSLDLRAQPELYRVGRGEQGVLLVEPYKSEILPHWRFATPDIARESSEAIYQMFLDYLADDDFVGADMARKFIQMGYTRARRYANHKGGKKYKRNKNQVQENKNTRLKDETQFQEYARYLMIKKVKAALMAAKNCHDKRKTQLKQNLHESLKLNGMNAVRTKII